MAFLKVTLRPSLRYLRGIISSSYICVGFFSSNFVQKNPVFSAVVLGVCVCGCVCTVGASNAKYARAKGDIEIRALLL